MTFTRLILPGLLGIASCTPAADQQPPGKVAPRRTRLDSLTTTRQVQQLVREMPNYQAFTLSDSLPQYCVGGSGCPASGPASSWLKADFDGNGRTDLLIAGYFGPTAYRRDIRCLLDTGGRTLHTRWFSRREYDCGQLQLIRAGNRPAVRFAHTEMTNAFLPQPRLVCQVDTLVFDKAQFVEYNPTPRDYQIQQVTFSTTACFGTCPVFSLHLDRSGAATYQAREYTKQPGDFTATVAARQVAELWALLNYLNFPRLKSSYAIPVTDHPTCILTITYAGGKVKIIEDYGEQGTFGLQRVYELLFRLRTGQAWKKVASLSNR